MNLFILFMMSLTGIIISYFVGYTNGFKKCREIDDHTIRELTNIYKQQLKEMY